MPSLLPPPDRAPRHQPLPSPQCLLSRDPLRPCHLPRALPEPAQLLGLPPSPPAAFRGGVGWRDSRAASRSLGKPSPLCLGRVRSCCGASVPRGHVCPVGTPCLSQVGAPEARVGASFLTQCAANWGDRYCRESMRSALFASHGILGNAGVQWKEWRASARAAPLCRAQA